MGTDIDAGVIPTGADIECDYEISDSGTITIEISIPCIGASFANHNFYSPQEGDVYKRQARKGIIPIFGQRKHLRQQALCL